VILVTLCDIFAVIITQQLVKQDMDTQASIDIESHSSKRSLAKKRESKNESKRARQSDLLAVAEKYK
jgi:hypothetical protein